MSTVKQSMRPHQRQAVKSIVAGLRSKSRGQCIMACGTGKTLIGCYVASGLKARTVLVLVPSLLLVRQVLLTFRAQNSKWRFLAVCSEDVTHESDQIRVSERELGCATTTSTVAVGEFLASRGPEVKVVICTYQSACVLVDRQFDLAIFDEAHRTAGRIGKPFAFALSDDNVRCKKRLFMTATPRHADLVESGATSELFAMDDPSVYGRVLYSMSLRRAIQSELVCDYRVVVSCIRMRGHEPREVAARASMMKMMRRYKVHKVFSFHKTIRHAEDFVSGEHGSMPGVTMLHVNGEQSPDVRRSALAQFAAEPKALITNARCLTEGIDLPNADAVAFMSPRHSVVDIVQAVGRCIRRYRGKTRCYIFLPVFLRIWRKEDNKSPTYIASEIARADFDPIFEVVQALRENDETFAASIVEGASAKDAQLPARIIVDAAEEDSKQVVAAINKAVTVKMLRPFRSTGEAKQKILEEMAHTGQKRPSSGSRDPYTKLLGHYLSSARRYAPLWLNKMREIVPLWFDTVRDDRYETLLLYALSGGPKPSGDHGDAGVRSLYTLLNTVKTKDTRVYKAVRQLAPSWFSEEDARLRARKNRRRRWRARSS